jgi:UDP-N-acetylglucosamine 2-epimerase (non-hydrolysing)
MPEEINRLVTDSITDLFFTTSEFANNNLIKEGVDPSRIFFVGNTMIDTLLENLNRIKQPGFFAEQKFEAGKYLVLTLHRPSNVDNASKLVAYLDQINMNRGTCRIIFPAHPRTKKILDETGNTWDGIFITDPQSYLNFIYLVKNAAGVITDSGGITEETTVLGIPCITLRNSTERPETVSSGTNELIGTDPGSLAFYLEKMLSGNWKKGVIPEKWDGKTGERIVDIILEQST